MRPCLPARSWSVRVKYCALCAALAVWSGCFGGQTGTEATPGDAGKQDSTKTGGTTATPSSTSNTAAPSTEGACAVPPSSTINLDAQTGITETAVVEFVRANNPVECRYDDGTVANATLTITASSAGCQAVTSSGPSSLSVPVTVQIVSDDARMNLSLDGRAVAYAATGGGVAEVEIDGISQCIRASDSALISRCAIGGIDDSAYAAVSVGLSARAQTIAGTTQWLGTLRISGSPSGSCSPQPCSISDWMTVTTISLSTSL